MAEGLATPIDTLKMAMATDGDTLTGEGVLAALQFRAVPTNRPSATALRISHVLLNDGHPSAHIKHGSVRVVGHDGSMGLDPNGLEPPVTVGVVVRDPDYDTQPDGPDQVLVRVGDGSDEEWLHLVEDGAEGGTFLGTVSVAFGPAVPGNGVVETTPGAQVNFCYDDSLSGQGTVIQRCARGQARHGFPGLLRATAVCEPGDSLRLHLTEGDLAGVAGPTEELTVLAVSPAAQDTERTWLAGVSGADGSFIGVLPTSRQPGPAGDGILYVARGDAVVLTYMDVLPHSGPPSPVSVTTAIVDPFGDADGNGLLQAYDAAQVLGHVLGPSLTGLDSLAANVDSLAPQGAITLYDATLILQHRVGLRSRFPVQEATAVNHPQTNPAAPTGRPLADVRLVELRPADHRLAVWLDDRSGVLCGDVVVAGVDGEVDLPGDMRHFLTASRQTPEGLRIVFAGPRPPLGPGPVAYVRGDGDWSGMRLARVTLNDGSIDILVRTEGETLSLPSAPTLYPVYPNPFNSRTTLYLYLPEPAVAQLEVFDALGQSVRVLASEALEAGHHRYTWDGRTARNQPVASGPYFCQLRAGPVAKSQRVLYLK